MDDICKICSQSVTKDSHYYKSHKITIADYHKKYFPKHDLLTGAQIPFKSKESYFLNDFINRTNLKKYLESQSEGIALDYLNNWLINRKKIKQIQFSPVEFETKSLMFPSLNYIDKKYGIESYDFICRNSGLEVLYDYFNLPQIKKQSLNFICDSREQAVLKLPNMQIAALNFGDYTVENSNIFVERKSLSDFISTLSQGYERFNREIQRCVDKKSYLIVLIEEKYSHLQSFEYLPHIHSKCDFVFISHQFRELIQKYPSTIQFLAVDGRKEATRIIEKIFKLKNDVQKIDLQFFYNKGDL